MCIKFHALTVTRLMWGETGRKFGVRLQEHRTEVEAKTTRTFTTSLRVSSQGRPVNVKHDARCVITEHVSGAGAENGAERARKPDERERDLKKYGGAERSGERAESAAHNPLKPND